MSDIQKTPLKNHIDFLTGFPFKSEGYTDNLTDIKLLCGDNIAQGCLRWDTVKRWPRVDKEKYGRYLLKEGDVVLAMDRPWIDAGLKFASVAPDDLPSLLLQRTARLRGSETLDIYYLRYIIGSPWFTKYVKNINTGSLVPHISGDQIKNFSFPVPPINHQRKVSAVLTAIDKKIELNNLINVELEAMAKLIYNYWFVQFDFPDANGKPYKSSGGKMVYNKTLKREIPDGWEVGSLGDIEPNIVTGKTPSTKKPENFKGNIPFICIGDVRCNMHITKTELTLSDLGADSQANKYIPKGAICVTCIASPGLVGFATENSQTNQQLNTVICSQVENQYLLYFYLKDHFMFAKAKTGNTFANMNKGDFSSIKVICPQKYILKRFTKHLQPTIDKILVNSKESNKLIELRDWLLPMLMNGQVTVTDASPSDGIHEKTTPGLLRQLK